MVNQLRPFTKTGWDGFAGATNFDDYSSPQIGETENFVVIATGDDVQGGSAVDVYFADESMYGKRFHSKEAALAVATVLLNATNVDAVLLGALGFDRY